MYVLFADFEPLLQPHFWAQRSAVGWACTPHISRGSTPLTLPAPVDVDNEDEPALIDLGCLGKTEVMHHSKITKPGIVALKRAGESGNVDIHVRQHTVSIVSWLRTHFVDRAAAQETRCIGASHNLGLAVYGMPPLTLTWMRTVDDACEEFVIEGIDRPNSDESSFSGVRTITIPLAVALGRLSAHTCQWSSGDTSVSASLVLHGTPLFAVQWTAQQKGKGRETTHKKTFSGSRSAFTMQPEASGAWRYAFARLSDANYKDLGLDRRAVE
ncbi:hypothetical protein AURDEDRAFT_170228 [Auricularia subglabra TFB-10046 SS5]|nr:hypothetical protein AURDEDRAFT_170228 [Auricularia subglabra TFB-10046 SS5]